MLSLLEHSGLNSTDRNFSNDNNRVLWSRYRYEILLDDYSNVLEYRTVQYI